MEIGLWDTVQSPGEKMSETGAEEHRPENSAIPGELGAETVSGMETG